jgi:predicted ferric reductase
MEDRGKLLYEEDIKERRAQAELNANHIIIFMSILFIFLAWSVLGYGAYSGIEITWAIVGFLAALFVTLVAFLIIDSLLRIELTQFLPIKIYERGILMPITIIDRYVWMKYPYIPYNNLNHIKVVKAQKKDKKDVLTAISMRRRSYPKRYDRNSKEVKIILESIRKAHPKVKVLMSE